MTARIRRPLTLALVFMALLLLAFVGTTLISFPIWFRYRGAPALGTIRTLAQAAAGLAGAGFFITAVIVAAATALQPAGRWRKLLYTLPIYLLGFTLAGAILFALGIGTVGPFTTTWLAAGALLSTIAVAIAAARARFDQRALRAALTAINITGVLSALACLGMIAAVAIVLTSQPSQTPAGPGGQARPEGQQGPGFEEGRGPRGGSTTPLLIGVALITVFGAAGWVSIARARRAARASADTPQAAPADYRRQAGQVVFSCIAITIVGLALAQFVPVKRDNPPSQAAVQWDSPQTQALAARACMDCHSNETRWPWYAYIAPGSWLLRSHVSSAREEFNLSALNTLPSFRASQLPDQVAQEIRSGAMPPKDYLILHPDAQLSEQEKARLIQGMQQSLSASLAK
jgi:hypothetical protein